MFTYIMLIHCFYTCWDGETLMNKSNNLWLIKQKDLYIIFKSLAC